MASRSIPHHAFFPHLFSCLSDWLHDPFFIMHSFLLISCVSLMASRSIPHHALFSHHDPYLIDGVTICSWPCILSSSVSLYLGSICHPFLPKPLTTYLWWIYYAFFPRHLPFFWSICHPFFPLNFRWWISIYINIYGGFTIRSSLIMNHVSLIQLSPNYYSHCHFFVSLMCFSPNTLGVGPRCQTQYRSGLMKHSVWWIQRLEYRVLLIYLTPILWQSCEQDLKHRVYLLSYRICVKLLCSVLYHFRRLDLQMSACYEHAGYVWRLTLISVYHSVSVSPSLFLLICFHLPLFLFLSLHPFSHHPRKGT